MPVWKLVAYRNAPSLAVAMTSPLKAAFTGDAQSSGTAMIPCVGSTAGFQPTIVPSSVANKKPELVPTPNLSKSQILWWN